MRDKTICYCCGAECKAWNDSGFMDCCALCADQVLIIVGQPPLGEENGYKYSGKYRLALDAVKAIYSIIWNPSSPKKIIGKIPICKRCNEPAEFAEPSDDFTCYRCSH